MEKNYLKYIEKFLGDSGEMKPIPTTMEAEFQKDASIKAVIFDVYGTILISASGDIDESEITTENLNRSLEVAGIMFQENSKAQQVLPEMLDAFRSEIHRVHEQERTKEKPYPEVDILEIWQKIINRQQEKKILIINGSACIECFTFIFEILSNKIYPMPGMKEIIDILAGRNIPMGIISNAQFYTPVLLNFFLHQNMNSTGEIIPFDPDLTVFSYKMMRSKPDLMLFNRVKENCLKKYHLNPQEILFLGNDMFRDIYPAHKTGFKTALFAGDKRSLRLQKEKPEVNNLVPDYVITDLYQLLKILP